MQLVEHKMNVGFYDSKGTLVKSKTVDCSDINQSRAIGREIAQWLAKGVCYRVESVTLSIKRL